MRIVECQKDTTTIAYRWLNAIALVGALLTGLLLLLMIGNHLALMRSDPIHAPALLKLTEDLKANPEDAATREQIRELDLLARHAFFSSQRFQKITIYLLLGCAAVTIVALKSLQAYRESVPYPSPNPPVEDLAANAKWARHAITGSALVLVGIALSLAIPWKSPLDAPQTAGTKTANTPTQPSAHEFARNWPRFWGAASGHTLAKRSPTNWDGSTGAGIRWKTKLARHGLSSPIIWDNRLFLTGGDETAREAYCFDTETGNILWTHQATGITGSPPKPPDVSDDTTFAASTMATDGTRVFAIFATGDLMALDLEGKRLWARNLGVPDNPYGHGSSLAVSDDLLLVQLDQRTNGAFMALDAETGNTRWKTARAFHPSWATPLVAEVDGKREFILAAAPAVTSYDATTGMELWRVACLDRAEVAPSPVLANGFVYVSAESVSLLAIDVAKHTLAWKDDYQVPGVSTPLVVGQLMFHGLDDGGIICRNALTGEKVWEFETDDGFYASPILLGDRVCLLDRSGGAYIFSATNQFKLIAQSKLGENSAGTPAVRGDSLFIRGAKHLFRIDP